MFSSKMHLAISGRALRLPTVSMASTRIQAQTSIHNLARPPTLGYPLAPPLSDQRLFLGLAQKPISSCSYRCRHAFSTSTRKQRTETKQWSNEELVEYIKAPSEDRVSRICRSDGRMILSWDEDDTPPHEVIYIEHRVRKDGPVEWKKYRVLPNVKAELVEGPIE